MSKSVIKSKQNSFDTTGQKMTAMGVEQMLNALDTEISYIKSEQQRPGWTVWAILGSLAVVVWQLLNEWGNSSFTTTNFAIWFLIFSLIEDIIGVPIRLLSPKDAQNKFGRRYYVFRQRFGEERLTLFLTLLRYVVLIGIVVTVGIAAEWYYTYSTYLYFFILMLILIVGLVLSFFRITLPIEIKWHTAVFMLFLLPLAILSALIYIDYATLHFKSVGSTDIRMGILLWAASYLLIILSQLGKKSALLLSLIATRRDLAFGRIDVKSALQRADIALVGMRLADVIQDDVRELLQIIEKIDDELRAIKTTYDIAESKLPKKKKKLTKKQIDLIDAIIEPSNEPALKAFRLIKQYNNKSERFERRISRIAGQPDKRDPEANQILDKIKAAKKEIEQRAFENAKKSELLSQNWGIGDKKRE